LNLDEWPYITTNIGDVFDGLLEGIGEFISEIFEGI